MKYRTTYNTTGYTDAASLVTASDVFDEVDTDKMKIRSGGITYGVPITSYTPETSDWFPSPISMPLKVEIGSTPYFVVPDRVLIDDFEGAQQHWAILYDKSTGDLPNVTYSNEWSETGSKSMKHYWGGGVQGNYYNMHAQSMRTNRFLRVAYNYDTTETNGLIGLGVWSYATDTYYQVAYGFVKGEGVLGGIVPPAIRGENVFPVIRVNNRPSADPTTVYVDNFYSYFNEIT